MKISYRLLNQYEHQKLKRFLIKINDVFNTPLNKRVEFEDYTNKILSKGIVIVAEIQDEIIGAIMGYTNNQKQKIGYASVFGIDKNYRNLGIGSILLKKMQKESYVRGMKTLNLYTNNENKKAIDFYQSRNFNIESDNSSRQNKDVLLVCDLEESIEKILVTAIGSFSAKTVIKSLNELGYYIIGSDIYPEEWIGTSQKVDTFIQAPYATEESNYVNFIHKITKNHSINMVIPLTDLEVDVLSKYKKTFNENNIVICISDKKTIDICRNKYDFQNLLNASVGYNIPTQIAELDNDISFPVFVKPIRGRSSNGTQLISTKEEYKNFIKHKDGEYIVQPYIEGIVVTVDMVRSPNEEKTICIPRKELLRNKSGAGTTVEIIQNKKIEEITRKIANKLNIVGAVNFEYIITNDNNLYVLEINPRFSGGIAFTDIAGYDIVKNHIAVFKNKKIDSLKNIEEMIIVKEYNEIVTKRTSN